jgi:ketosteroid isomerase-like protein
LQLTLGAIDLEDHAMPQKVAPAIAALALGAGLAQASPEDDRRTVAALDTEFQAAVKHHDVATIDRIQHPDMVLVLGDTAVVTALLRLKGTNEGAAFDRRVWFSDTYVRTPEAGSISSARRR